MLNLTECLHYQEWCPYKGRGALSMIVVHNAANADHAIHSTASQHSCHDHGTQCRKLPTSPILLHKSYSLHHLITGGQSEMMPMMSLAVKGLCAERVSGWHIDVPMCGYLLHINRVLTTDNCLNGLGIYWLSG